MSIPQALNNYILIEPFPAKEKTDGGIFIVYSAMESSNVGTVLSVGRKVTQVKVGDTVMFELYQGFKVPVEGKKDTFVTMEDAILGIMEDYEHSLS